MSMFVRKVLALQKSLIDKRGSQMNQNQYETVVNSGSHLIADNPKRAIRLIKQGILLKPKEAVGWYNLGIALHEDKNISGSIACYKKALESNNPPSSKIINNLAQDLLLNRNFEEGWKFYEHRLKRIKSGMDQYQALYGKPLSNLKDFDVKSTLLVICEQGYGDTIQFCRYILRIQSLGIHVKCFCPEAISQLLRQGTEIKNVVTLLKEDQNNCEWVSLMSPNVLKDFEKVNSIATPYIKCTQEYIVKWKLLLKNRQKRNLGVHWQGNPKFEKVYTTEEINKYGCLFAEHIKRFGVHLITKR